MLKKMMVGLLLTTWSVEAIKIPVDPSEKKPVKPEVYKKVWETTYGEKYDDIAEGVVALEEGHSAIVGTCQSFEAQSRDICVIRMDADGKVIWRLLLGGKKRDEGKAIARASDGSLLILGMTKSLAKDYDADIYVAKVSLEGKLLWENAMGGARDEFPAGIAGTDDGGVMFVGDTESFGKGYRDIYIGRLTKEGKVVFTRTVGGKKTDEARGLTRVKDGNFVLVGMREVDNRNYEEFFVMKFDENAKVLWSKTFGDYDDDSLESVTATMDGGIVAIGKTRSYGSAQTDLTVMKLSSEGKTLWHKIYGFKYYEYGNAVTMTPDGGFMLAGGTSTLGKGSHSVYMLGLDKNGTLIWSHVYGGVDRDIPHGIARMSDGSIMVVGQSDSFKRAKNFYMIKIDKNEIVKNKIDKNK